MLNPTPETMILISGILASVLIGVVYLSPLVTLLKLKPNISRRSESPLAKPVDCQTVYCEH